MIDFQEWKQSCEAVPFRYGVNDCCLVLADWAFANGYSDGATALRGAYQDEEEMYRLIALHGDVAGIVGLCASIAGCRQVQRQSVGSISVIGSPSNMRRQWGAIWDGSRWQVRLAEGFTAITARPLKIWAV